MLREAIELLEVEIQRLEFLVEKFREPGVCKHTDYCACEVRRFRRILNLLLVVKEKELGYEK